MDVTDRPLSFPPQGVQKSLKEVAKTPDVMEELHAMAARGFSPSALTKYLKNPYQFYRTQVLGEREGEEVEEQADARIVGQVIHRVFEELLTPQLGKPLTPEVLESLAEDKRIPQLVKEAFAALEYQDLTTGYNALLNATINKLVRRNLRAEAAELRHAAETRVILALEKELKAPLDGVDGAWVRGFADRIDLRGDQVVVLDYNTGYVESKLTLKPEKLEDDPFKEDKMLQLGLYIYLAEKNQKENGWPGTAVGAGLIKIRASQDVFYPLEQTSPEALAAFMDGIKAVVQEILNPNHPFIEKPEKNVTPRY